MDYQSSHYDISKYTQNSLEYVMQNMAHQEIQIYKSMLELIF